MSILWPFTSLALLQQPKTGPEVTLMWPLWFEATPLLQHQILKHGYLIYERDPKERTRQEVAARREYLDTTFLYRVIEDYL